MSPWLVLIQTLIYAYVALEQGWDGRFPMAIMYAGYTVGNIGLYLMLRP